MRRFIAIVVVVAFLPALHVAKACAQDKEQVDALHTEAMRSNHDIRVAQAELRAAELRFERFRFNLQTRVAAAVDAVETARAHEKDAKAARDRVSKNHISREEYAILVLNCIKAQAERIVAESRIQALVGRKKANSLPKELVLKDLQAEAGKANPDYHFEEAKLRLAEAEYERDRRTLLAKVDILHAELTSAIATESEGNQRLTIAKRLFEMKAISREELEAAETTARKLKHERIVVERCFNQILGRPAVETEAKKKVK
jgi:hypothetical protein